MHYQESGSPSGCSSDIFLLDIVFKVLKWKTLSMTNLEVPQNLLRESFCCLLQFQGVQDLLCVLI